MNVRNPALQLTGPEPAALGPGDLEACLALDQLCFAGLWSREQWRRELADGQRPGLGLWREERLVAMACAWLVVDELHITLVAVDPARRRQGLARSLLGALLLRGRRLGATRATLEVSSGNPAALGLYQALGFQSAGVRRAYYSGGDDALIQWLELDALG
jgi:ribosomal-protein-alanine N-acetyltransferase